MNHPVAMLNLSWLFDGVTHALTHYPDHLSVAPLPAAVYMMQVDVLNHYRYALDHYFTLTLKEPYLQNSSLGSPYEKWAYFTNEDFLLLSISIHNLMRYSSRLVHESEMSALRQAEPFSSNARKSNGYTGPLAELRYHQKTIGVSVRPDHTLLISRIRSEPSRERLIARSISGGPAAHFRVVQGNDGTEVEEPIDASEFHTATETIQTSALDIRDRSVLSDLREQGHAEISQINSLNLAFATACDAFYATRRTTTPFENLNESYWM